MANKRKLFREILYWFVRVESIILIILSILGLIRDGANRDSHYIITIIQAVLMTILTFIPALFKKVFKINIPIIIEICYLMFCSAAILLGEIFNFYIKYSWWDDLLHVFSGSFISIIGFIVIYYLNEKKNVPMSLSPAFIILFVFCFSLAAELVWEVIEWSIDGIFSSNMQRYMHDTLKTPFAGRSALLDTMGDMIEAIIGSIIVCVLTFIEMKREDSSIKKMLKLEEDLPETQK